MTTTDLKRNSVDHYKFDRLAWEKTRKITPVMDEVVDEYKDELKVVENLAQDVYHALFKENPQVLPESQIAPEHQIQKPLIENMLETPEYQKLHNYTQHSEIPAMLGTISIVENIMNNLPDELLEKQKEKEKWAEKRDELEDLLEQGFPVHQELEEHMAGAPSDENGCDMLRSLAYRAVAQAADQAEGFDELCMGWGLDPGDPGEMDPTEFLNMARKLKNNHRIVDMADFLGKLKRLAIWKQKTKVEREPVEVVDIELGDNLRDMLPEEAIYLMDKDLETLWYKRFFAKELRCRKKENKEKKAKGSIVCCVDVSGSMSGQPIAWAKSFALALLEIAKLQKRDFVGILFDGCLQGTWEFPKNLKPKDFISRQMEFASFFSGGGTNFEAPLNAAMEHVKKGKNEPDIIFITDGFARCSDGFLAEFEQMKKEMECTVYGLTIGRFEAQPASMSFCNHVASIESVLTDGDATEIFGQI